MREAGSLWLRAAWWPLWIGVTLLVTLALVAVVGRAITLTGGEPFAPLYPMLPSAAVEDMRILDRWFEAHALLTWTHILLGGLVLALAPFQFMPWMRRRHLRLHRWSGRALLIAAIPAGLSGLLLQARSPYGGITAGTAIAFFGTLFLIALARAYAAIRRGDVRQHREWMIRMLAVGLGVGAVRAVAPPLVLLTDRRPLELVGATFWLGLGLTVIAGEVWIRCTRAPSPAHATRAAIE
jgi:uncharacterized membrane protein